MIRFAPIIVFLSCLVGSNPAAAEAEPFPGYDRLCGFPIVYQPTPRVSLAAKDAGGQSVIILDPSLETPEEAVRRKFLIAHECAHHQMGHTSPGQVALRIRSHRIVRDHEMSADCRAAEMLAEAGEDKAVRLMTDRFYRSGLYSPGGGYPSGIQRSAIIHQCANVARRRVNGQK